MMSNENLITLIYSKPEIWDQSHEFYTSKEDKLRAWKFIAEKMKVRAEVAKARWTNLRDLFRRELKKVVQASRETGDPDAYRPRWRHFRSMLFLRDQIKKDGEDPLPSLTFEDTSSLYPQTILEDGEDSKTEDEPFGEGYSPSSTPPNLIEMTMVSEPSQKRHADSASNTFDPKQKTKKPKREYRPEIELARDYPDFASGSYTDMDEDYHFVMSILPSVRRVRPDRKTSFKMKVLQLIMEEENCCGD